MTLTFRKGVGLDCVEEGLDQSCHEASSSVLLCRVLVLWLGEALLGRSCRTSTLGRDGLRQAEPQQQNSHTGPERSSAALPPPAPRPLT